MRAGLERTAWTPWGEQESRGEEREQVTGTSRGELMTTLQEEDECEWDAVAAQE